MDINVRPDTNRTDNTNTSQMLKWTVNKPGGANQLTATQPNSSARSTAAAMSIFVDIEPPSASRTRRSLGTALLHQTVVARHKQRDPKRKSLGSVATTNKLLRNHNKENLIMLSPHTNNMRNSPTTSTPHAKADFAFREIGNLTPSNNTSSSNHNGTPLRKTNLPPSPSPQSNATINRSLTPHRPRLFAATLPTLDIEYSPANNVERVPVQHASPRSVHGITVQNGGLFGSARYFAQPAELPTMAKKPRIHSELITPLAYQLSKLRFSQVSLRQPADDEADDETLNMSSKSLDDTELEKMIDEILESTRKVRKLPRSVAEPVAVERPSGGGSCAVTTSTSAGDAVPVRPANVAAADRTIIIVAGEREREVRTPDSTCDLTDVVAAIAQTPGDGANDGDNADECQLRRQRVVRRKHTTKVKKSNDCAELQLQREQLERLARMDTPQTAATATMITPPGIEADDVQGTSTPTILEQQQQQQQQLQHQPQQLQKQPTVTRRCLRYPDSPDSMEDSLEKRQSVASSTASTTSTLSRCNKSGSTLLFGTLDVTLAIHARQVHVHVLRCRDLSRTSGGPINAYVKVTLLTIAETNDPGFQRTAVQRNSAEPIFEHRFVFDNISEMSERVQLSVWHRDREYKRSEFLGCLSFPVQSLYACPISGTYRLQSQSNLAHPTNPILLQAFASHVATTHESAAAVYSDSSSIAERSTNNTAISLSKNAIHQRDADEHLFLRHLQLNPSSGNQPSAVGRTACTLSKRLTADAIAGFGFTVVWTHPPRVEKVEPGLPAELAGIVPGDFIAFVGEHNVVTMPEADVLNLIRSQGPTLDIEVFRKPVAGTAKRTLDMLAASGRSSSAEGVDGQRSKMARVEFCDTIGSGIIV